MVTRISQWQVSTTPHAPLPRVHGDGAKINVLLHTPLV